jgi:hypothetical protein
MTRRTYIIPRPFKPFRLCSDWLASSSRHLVFCWHPATTTPKKTLVGMPSIWTWIQAATFSLGKTHSKAGTALIMGRIGTRGGGCELRVGLRVPRFRRFGCSFNSLDWDPRTPGLRRDKLYGTHGTYGSSAWFPTLNRVIGGFSNLFDEPELGFEFREVGVAFVLRLHTRDQEFAAAVN